MWDFWGSRYSWRVFSPGVPSICVPTWKLWWLPPGLLGAVAPLGANAEQKAQAEPGLEGDVKSKHLKHLNWIKLIKLEEFIAFVSLLATFMRARDVVGQRTRLQLRTAWRSTEAGRRQWIFFCDPSSSNFSQSIGERAIGRTFLECRWSWRSLELPGGAPIQGCEWGQVQLFWIPLVSSASQSSEGSRFSACWAAPEVWCQLVGEG